MVQTVLESDEMCKEPKSRLRCLDESAEGCLGESAARNWRLRDGDWASTRFGLAELCRRTRWSSGFVGTSRLSLGILDRVSLGILDGASEAAGVRMKPLSVTIIVDVEGVS